MADYWSYWVHRVQELWNNYELLNRRVAELEAKVAELQSAPVRPQAEATRPPEKVVQSAQEQGENAPSAAVAVALLAIKHLGRPASVEEINDILRKQGIDESLKETLLGRLKEAVQKGFLAYDPESKKFGLTG